MLTHPDKYPALKACYLKSKAAEDASVNYLKKNDKQYEMAWQAVEKDTVE